MGCGHQEANYDKQVIVLGFDGMDYGLCSAMMDQGRLPHLAELARRGTFTKLGTSTPPQSPVAWSNMMTGTDGGRHGVFDFIHRDPVEGFLLSSSAELDPPAPLPVIGNHLDRIHMFGYQFSLRPTGIKINRHSRAFWEFLTQAGVPAQVFRIPANYPPTPSSGADYRTLSDMGTVDILDTLGTFAYYTEAPDERNKKIPRDAGALYPIVMDHDRADSVFVGPVNEYLAEPAGTKGRTRRPRVNVAFSIYRDPTGPVANIRFQGRDVLLREGEWSDWQPIAFEMIPHLVSLKGICRFYLKQVHPYLKLYVSPFNLDPQEKSWQIDQPADFSVTVSDSVGRYYTQGLPEDTEALINHVLTRDEFLQQAELVLQERLKLLDYAMDHYHGGCLFFYFGSTDQIAHMFWCMGSADHPAVTPEERRKYKNVMQDLYVRMDGIVGMVAERFADATLIVMSDHGFSNYRRRFSLNTWLKNNGYAGMRRPSDPKMMANFDAAKTRAYGIGFSGLYINLKGRERGGIVDPADKQALMDELAAKLKAYRDPDTGARVVQEVYQCDKIFSGPMRDRGPDMIIGYALGYRSSGESAMGAFPEYVVEDNKRAWCGDHFTAPYLVPGILCTNRKVGVDDPTLLDLAPTILHAFDVEPPPYMKGRNLFSSPG